TTLCPTRSTPFPYTTLFRSTSQQQREGGRHARKPGDLFILHALQRGLRKGQRIFQQQLGTRDEVAVEHGVAIGEMERQTTQHLVDRKSTRLNSSHVKISYAV